MRFVTEFMFFVRSRIIRIRCRVIRSQEIPYEAYASQKNTKEPKENTWCYTLFLSFVVVALHLDLEIKSVEMKSPISPAIWYHCCWQGMSESSYNKCGSWSILAKRKTFAKPSDFAHRWNPKVWDSTPPGESELIICPTLVTRQKISLSLHLYRSQNLLSLLFYLHTIFTHFQTPHLSAKIAASECVSFLSRVNGI